jgi:hypothetical protein
MSTCRGGKVFGDGVHGLVCAFGAYWKIVLSGVRPSYGAFWDSTCEQCLRDHLTGVKQSAMEELKDPELAGEVRRRLSWWVESAERQLRVLEGKT